MEALHVAPTTWNGYSPDMVIAESAPLTSSYDNPNVETEFNADSNDNPSAEAMIIDGVPVQVS